MAFAEVPHFRRVASQALNRRAARIAASTLAAAVILAASFIVVAPATAAGVDPGALTAEVAPLASRALLLDIASAGSRLVAVGERGHVLLSDNRGQSWRQAKQVPTQALLTGVCFSDERHGIAVGHDEIALATADSGETWARTHYAPESQQPLLDVLCNGSDAIAVGAYGVYFTSADSGATWNEQKFSAQKPVPSALGAPDAATAKNGSAAVGTGVGAGPIANAAAEDDEYLGADFHLNRIVGASGSRLYIAGEAGHLYRSDDAGAKWTELPSPYEGSFFGVLPLNGDSLLAYGLRGHLFRSDDGGLHWKELNTATQAMLNDAARLPGDGVVVAGLSGTVLVSHDNGATFKLRQQEDRKGLSAVLPIGATEVVSVGEGGVKLIPISVGP